MFEAGLGVLDAVVEFGEGASHLDVLVLVGSFHAVEELAFLAAEALLAFFERGDGGGSAAMVQLLSGFFFEVEGSFLGGADECVHQLNIDAAAFDPFEEPRTPRHDTQCRFALYTPCWT